MPWNERITVECLVPAVLPTFTTLARDTALSVVRIASDIEQGACQGNDSIYLSFTCAISGFSSGLLEYCQDHL